MRIPGIKNTGERGVIGKSNARYRKKLLEESQCAGNQEEEGYFLDEGEERQGQVGSMEDLIVFQEQWGSYWKFSDKEVIQSDILKILHIRNSFIMQQNGKRG